MTPARHLFGGFGVELEYMIVDRESLAVLPVTDRVLHVVAGAYESEIEQGQLRWSNELVLHVVELKTNGPADALAGLAELFQRDVGRINDILDPLGGRLMPTAMHPWMDPHRETHLWPHEYNAVYQAFNRIFDCTGHGWSNLQCTHLNLPFANDEEFGRLHAAIRMVLPILPALAASSPICDEKVTRCADTRLEVYRTNSASIPSLSGRIIPEAIFSARDYEQQILQRIYADLAPHDPEGTLQFEWANARGAIARFDRHTIEIRLLDIQECPRADLAILELVVETIRALVQETWCSYAEQRRWQVEPLEEILLGCVRNADRAVINNPDYLRMFGLVGTEAAAAAHLWRHVFDGLAVSRERPLCELEPLRVILNEGCLASRIVAALGDDPTRVRVSAVYRELCDCLREGRMFHA